MNIKARTAEILANNPTLTPMRALRLANQEALREGSNPDRLHWGHNPAAVAVVGLN